MPIDSVEFSEAYEQHFPRTVRLLAARGVPSDAADEFAQRAWVKAWERRGELRKANRLPQWVNTIALNAFRSWLRHCRRERQLDAVDGSGKSTLTTHCLVHELLNASKTYGHILESFYLGGYSAEEIAVKHNTSPLAIRIRLSRARAALRSELHGARPAKKKS